MLHFAVWVTYEVRTYICTVQIIHLCNRYISISGLGQDRPGYYYPCAFHNVKCGHWVPWAMLYEHGHVLHTLYARVGMAYARVWACASVQSGHGHRPPAGMQLGACLGLWIA